MALTVGASEINILFLLLRLLIELINVNNVFLYEILLFNVCSCNANISEWQKLFYWGFLIDDFRIWWKPDLPLTVIFVIDFVAIHLKSVWAAVLLQICRIFICLLGLEGRISSFANVFIIPKGWTFTGLSIFILRILLILNTDDIWTCSSLEPALIGHLVACDKRLALLEEARFAVLLIRELDLVTLSNALHTIVILVSIDSLGCLRFIWHETFGCACLEGRIDGPQIARAYGAISCLVFEVVLVLHNLHWFSLFLLSMLCLGLYRNRLHVEGTTRVRDRGCWPLSENAFCYAGAPPWRSTEYF